MSCRLGQWVRADIVPTPKFAAIQQKNDELLANFTPVSKRIKGF